MEILVSCPITQLNTFVASKPGTIELLYVYTYRHAYMLLSSSVKFTIDLKLRDCVNHAHWITNKQPLLTQA